MSFRNVKNPCVIASTVVHRIQCQIGVTVVCCFAVKRGRLVVAKRGRVERLSGEGAGQGFAVDINGALDKLYSVPRQADNPLDVVCIPVMKNNHIAPFGPVSPDPARKKPGMEGQGVVGKAIGVFGNKQMVTFNEGGAHGAGRDMKGLKQESPCDKDQQNDHYTHLCNFFKHNVSGRFQLWQGVGHKRDVFLTFVLYTYAVAVTDLGRDMGKKCADCRRLVRFVAAGQQVRDGIP